MKTEKVLFTLFIIGLIFKFNLWPGGGVITILSLLGIAFCYFPFGFYFINDKPVFKKKVGLSILYGWLLSITLTGILFKLMMWPGSYFMLLIGGISIIPLLIVAFILFNKSDEESKVFHKNLLTRTSIIAIFAFAFFIISSESVLKFQYRNDPKLYELKLNEFNSDNPEEAHKRTMEYIEEKEKADN